MYKKKIHYENFLIFLHFQLVSKMTFKFFWICRYQDLIFKRLAAVYCIWKMRPYRWPPNCLQDFIVPIGWNTIDLSYFESIPRVFHLYLKRYFAPSYLIPKVKLYMFFMSEQCYIWVHVLLDEFAMREICHILCLQVLHIWFYVIIFTWRVC